MTQVPCWPLWARDGKSLYYLRIVNGRYEMVVRAYDVAPGGERFYALQFLPVEPRPPVTHINLILNWFDELKAKVPAGGAKQADGCAPIGLTGAGAPAPSPRARCSRL